MKNVRHHLFHNKSCSHCLYCHTTVITFLFTHCYYCCYGSTEEAPGGAVRCFSPKCHVMPKWAHVP